MIALLVAGVVFGDEAPARAPQSATARAFAEHWAAAAAAIAARDYRQAAARYTQVATLLPYEPSCRIPLAGCLARLGEADAAFAELNAAIGFGWCDPAALESSADLETLRKDPRFAGAVRAAAACRDETLVVRPTRGRPAGLLVVLHGLGCGPRSEVPYWAPAADALGLVIAAPRAPTRFGPMLFGWHRAGAKDSAAADYYDLDAAQLRVEGAIAEARRRYPAATGPLALAGFSQGAGVALRLLADQPDRYRGAVAVCGLHPATDPGRWQRGARSGVRVHLIAGEYDKLLPRSRAAADALRAAGVPTRFDVVTAGGHEFPADAAERMRSALRDVFADDARKD